MKIGRLIITKLHSNVCTFSKMELHYHIHNLAHIKKKPAQYHLGALELKFVDRRLFLKCAMYLISKYTINKGKKNNTFNVQLGVAGL